LKLAPTVSRRGTEASRKDAREVQEFIGFPSGFRSHPSLPKYKEGGLGENGWLAEKLRPPFPALWGTVGIRTHKEGLDGAGKGWGMSPDAIARAARNPARRGTSAFHSS
jgi:hypothetical protein